MLMSYNIQKPRNEDFSQFIYLQFFNCKEVELLGNSFLIDLCCVWQIYKINMNWCDNYEMLI
jgi:hypothetical protein